jgi:hypothetical protein
VGSGHSTPRAENIGAVDDDADDVVGSDVVVVVGIVSSQLTSPYYLTRRDDEIGGTSFHRLSSAMSLIPPLY